MSNHLAIATVSAALGAIVHRAAESAVNNSVSLFFGRPSPPANGELKVHVYLYQVTPNPALRNHDLPTRSKNGRLTQRPQAALDLHYLLSFYGNDASWDADRMLGAVTRDLHAKPALDAAGIEAVTGLSGLEASNLLLAAEKVKFSPTPMSLDEMSKLWSVLVQSPHTLSVAYQGSVVVIDAEETAPPALPVLSRGELDQGVSTSVSAFPRLNGWWAGFDNTRRTARGPSLPALMFGARLILEGENFSGARVELLFTRPLQADLRFEIPQENRNARQVIFDLPSIDEEAATSIWAAGVYTLTVINHHDRETRKSNVQPIALAPQVIAVPQNVIERADGIATLNIACRPQVLPGQRIYLLLEGREIPAQTLLTASETLTFSIADAPAVNDALVRLRIDGVDSLPFHYDTETQRLVFEDRQRVTIR